MFTGEYDWNMFTSSLPDAPGFIFGVASIMFQFSGKSYLAISGGGDTFDADDGR